MGLQKFRTYKVVSQLFELCGPTPCGPTSYLAASDQLNCGPPHHIRSLLTSQKLLVLKIRTYLQFFCDVLFHIDNKISRSKCPILLLRRSQTHKRSRRVRQKTFDATFAFIGGRHAVRSNSSKGYTLLVWRTAHRIVSRGSSKIKGSHYLFSFCENLYLQHQIVNIQVNSPKPTFVYIL